MLENMVRIHGSVEYVHEAVEITVNAGTFRITDNALCARDQIYCRNFKIGVDAADV